MSVNVYAVAGNAKEQKFWCKFEEVPLIGDTVAIDQHGVFKVVERGQKVTTKKKAGAAWVMLDEIEGLNIAPSGRYNFMDDLT